MKSTLISRNVLGVFAVTLVLFLASGLIEPALLSAPSVSTVLLLTSFVVLVSFGQGLVILSGGLDLSVGSIITLGGALLGAWVPESNAHLAYAVPVILAIGCGIGILNGIGVAVLRIPAFVMTLAMGIIIQSVVLALTQGAPAANSAPGLVAALSNSHILEIPLLVWSMLVFVVLAAVIQDMSTLGREVHALGANPRAATIAGLRSNWLIIACYALSGLSAALCGIVLLGFVGAPTLSMGDPYTIESVAAVVVGGSSILGGSGYFIGTVGGALFLGVLSNDMTAMGMSAGWRTLIEGGIIVMALLVFSKIQAGGLLGAKMFRDRKSLGPSISRK